MQSCSTEAALPQKDNVIHSIIFLLSEQAAKFYMESKSFIPLLVMISEMVWCETVVFCGSERTTNMTGSRKPGTHSQSLMLSIGIYI